MNLGGDRPRKASIIGLVGSIGDSSGGGTDKNARRASFVEAHTNFAQINQDMAKKMAGSFRGRSGSVSGRKQSLIG